MTDFESVAKVGDIPEGQGVAYEVNGRLVAIFNLAGAFHAIDDFCPHMGASLAGGHVEDGVVFCPWHAWRFRVTDGTWCDNPTIKIDHFEVRVVGEEVQVKVPPKEDLRQPGSSVDATNTTDSDAPDDPPCGGDC